MGNAVEPILLAVLASLCFGLALLLTQYGLRYASPRRGALVSIPTTALLLWFVSPLTVNIGDWDTRAAAIFATVGLVFPAVVTLLTFEANQRMGPPVSGALGNLAPLFAVLLAAVLLGEVPSPLQILGVATISAGVVALSMTRHWLDATWRLGAIALPIGAAAIRGLVQPIIKYGLALWPSSFAAALTGYTVSALIIGIAIGPHFDEQPIRVSRSGFGWFAAVGICNGSAVLAMYSALRLGSVVLVSPLVATYPLFTLLLTAIFWRTARITTGQVVGIAMTVCGVALVLLG